MKKICILILILLTLAGCASPDAPAGQENFTFAYNGVEIVLHAEAAPVVEVLGEPKSYTEAPSCAFEGMDKTYYYGSFYVSTYPRDGRDYVYSVWFADDSVATAEGIRIGTPQSQVEEAYGKDSFNGSNAYVLNRESSRLVILVTDGVVSSIQYEVILD